MHDMAYMDDGLGETNGPDLRGTKLKLWGVRGSRGYSIYVYEEFESLWTIIVTNTAFRSKGAK